MMDFKEIPMEIKAKALREAIKDLTPGKSVPVIQSFGLTQDEEKYIIQADVERKSVVQIAMENNVSPEVVKRRREKAYARMILELNS